MLNNFYDLTHCSLVDALGRLQFCSYQLGFDQWPGAVGYRSVAWANAGFPMSPYGVTRPQWVKPLSSSIQNGVLAYDARLVYMCLYNLTHRSLVEWCFSCRRTTSTGRNELKQCRDKWFRHMTHSLIYYVNYLTHCSLVDALGWMPIVGRLWFRSLACCHLVTFCCLNQCWPGFSMLP